MQHICESSTQSLDYVKIPNRTIKVPDYQGQKSQPAKIGFLYVIFSLWGPLLEIVAKFKYLKFHESKKDGCYMYVCLAITVYLQHMSGMVTMVNRALPRDDKSATIGTGRERKQAKQNLSNYLLSKIF